MLVPGLFASYTRGMELVDEFYLILGKINVSKEPETLDKLVEQSGLVAEALERCEKLLLYFATSESGREEMITYLFQYKQLMKLQQRFDGLQPALQRADAALRNQGEAARKKPWWRLR